MHVCLHQYHLSCVLLGSMSEPDGHIFLKIGEAHHSVTTTRWEELSEALKFHIELVKCSGTQAEFRFLNGDSVMISPNSPEVISLISVRYMWMQYNDVSIPSRMLLLFVQFSRMDLEEVSHWIYCYRIQNLQHHLCMQRRPCVLISEKLLKVFENMKQLFEQATKKPASSLPLMGSPLMVKLLTP